MIKIGDKVRVRDTDKVNQRCIGLTGSVVWYRKDCDYFIYQVLFKDSRGIFTIVLKESMLEPVTVTEDNNKYNSTNAMPKLETGMIVINKHDKVGVVAGNEIWYNDGGIDDVEEVLMYLERNKFDGYIKYIIKNRSGFTYIQHNLSDIKFNNFVPNVEVYQKFGHKVKIVDQQ